MSVTAMAAVWRVRGLDGGERVVLLRLADVAHNDGSNAWLSVATMAEDCELDRRTVQRILRRLEDAGCLEVQSPPRQHRPTVYRLTLPDLMPAAEPVYVDDDQGRRSAAPGSAPIPIQGRRRGGAGAAPAPPDPDPDPKKDHDNHDTRARAKGSRAPQSVTETLKDLAYRALYGLRGKCVAEAMVPMGVDLDMREWAESLSPADVVRIEEELGGQYAWPYARAVIGRCAAARRDGRDPWEDRGTARAGRDDTRNARRGGLRGAGGGRRPSGDVAASWDATLASRRAERDAGTTGGAD